MRDNSFVKSQCKVNFSYVNSPIGQQMSQVVKERFSTNVQSNIEMSSKKNVNHIEAKLLPSNYTSQNYSKQQNTLKKEGWGIEANTLRKTINNKKPENNIQEGEMISLDGFSHEGTFQTNETCMLKEQIRYMRRRLIEVQNAEKELRLQFQMYKACNEQQNQFVSSKEVKSQQINNVQKKIEESIKNENQEILNEQIGELSAQLQRVIELNKNIMEKMKDQSMQSQSKRILIEQLKNKIQQEEQNLKHSQQEILNLKELNKKEYTQKVNVQSSLQKILQQNKRLNGLLQVQKANDFQLQDQLKNSIINSNQLTDEIAQLKSQLEKKNRDIEFLNSQSIALDQSLINALQEIKYLHGLLAQNKQDQQSSFQINKAKDQQKQLEEKVIVLETQIEKMAVVIYQLREKYQAALHQVKEDTQLVQKLKQSSTQILKEKTKSEIIMKNSSNIYLENVDKLESQVVKLREQNKQLKSSSTKLQESQKILLNELEWIKKQRDTAIIAKQQQVCKMQDQITFLKNKLKQKIQQSDEKMKKMKETPELRNIDEIKVPEKADVQTKISQNSINSGQSLSKQQLQKHILLLKNQPSHNDEQLIKLRQQLEATRQQIQFIKIKYSQEIDHLKARYERQIKVNNQQYLHQLNVYTENIESLMAQMDLIKKNSKYYNSVIEQQEEENDMDQINVKKDIIKYSEDQSDFYVSPPSNAQTKPIQNAVESDITQSGNYVLKDLIDLDTKINNYIQNFNKSKPSRS